MSGSAQNGTVEGWVWGPNGRGTIDIIWPSIFTIVLCSWNTIYLNISPPHWTWARRFYQKLLFFGLSILSPNIILQIAFGQWASARRSVKAFATLRRDERAEKIHNPWTMRHAFLADMGCFRLDLDGCRDCPLDAKQVYSLVEGGHVDYSQVGILKTEIDDRDKGSGILLLITAIQILWFSINLNGRAWFGNSITPLELTAISYVLPTLVTFWLWRHKPLDSRFTILLAPTITMAETKDINIFPTKARDSKNPHNSLRKMPWWAVAVCMLLEALYVGIHIWGWDLFFPSGIERDLWRYASLVMAGCMVGFWIHYFYVYHCHKRIVDTARRTFRRSTSGNPNRRSSDSADLERGYDTASRPLKVVIPIIALAICYLAARGYVIAECFANLRLLPEGAYQNIMLPDILPNIG